MLKQNIIEFEGEFQEKNLVGYVGIWREISGGGGEHLFLQLDIILVKKKFT